MPSRRKIKGRAEKGAFTLIPHTVMDNPDFFNLSTKSVKLLLDLAYQYRGKNNGNLTAAFSILRKRGWKREATICAAIKELMAANLIIRTRDGYFQNPKSRCALYALTWHPIDDCLGKDLDVSPTTTPPRKFSLENKQNTHYSKSNQW